MVTLPGGPRPIGAAASSSDVKQSRSCALSSTLILTRQSNRSNTVPVQSAATSTVSIALFECSSFQLESNTPVWIEYTPALEVLSKRTCSSQSDWSQSFGSSNTACPTLTCALVKTSISTLPLVNADPLVHERPRDGAAGTSEHACR